MTESRGGSAKSNSGGLFVDKCKGGDTHTPRPLETYYDATGAPGPEGLQRRSTFIGPAAEQRVESGERRRG